MHRPSFFSIFSLTIKDKTNILHLRHGSFTRKVRTVFTLKIIVSIFVKLFLILVLRQFFIVRIFVKRAIALGICCLQLAHTTIFHIMINSALKRLLG